MKLKKGDQIIVLAGKDKGKKGQIESVLPAVGQVIVPGINVAKKHLKTREGHKGGIIDLVKPLYVSKVALICPKCNRSTRIGYQIIAKQKTRICRKCREVI